MFWKQGRKTVWPLLSLSLTSHVAVLGIYDFVLPISIPCSLFFCQLFSQLVRFFFYLVEWLKTLIPEWLCCSSPSCLGLLEYSIELTRLLFFGFYIYLSLHCIATQFLLDNQNQLTWKYRNFILYQLNGMTNKTLWVAVSVSS